MSYQNIVDDNETSTPGDVDKLKSDLQAAITEADVEADQDASEKAEAEANELPEKYRGKSAAEIAEMHRNAESELGRRSSELGQYKRLTDELLALKRHDDLAKGGASADETDDEEPLPTISSSDLLDDPTSSIEKLLSAREKSLSKKEQRRRAQELQLEAQRKFMEEHPDAETIVQSKEFVEWVNGSPARSVLGYQAANGDLASGAALLAEWKLGHGTPEELEAQEERERLEKARKAVTESASVSSTPDSGATGKKYRRLDLIRLKLEDPEAYADENFQREILKAYAEKRVI